MESLRPNDPRQIGRYTLVARLGAGGMGVVFLAQAGSETVALKVVRSSYLDSKDLHSRFIREIETLKQIDSPHVAKIRDFGVDGDTSWHAVEFVSGPTLRDKVEADGPLNSHEWDQLASQLRHALYDIHRLGIVHRDIKPANLVMGETGMKLIDFGIAQDDDATSLTMTGLVAGSPAWLSPERLDGDDDSPASDLFSAGSVLFFAATGRNPWSQSETPTISAVITRIISGNPDLTELNPRQQFVVSSLLEREPSRREWKSPKPEPPAVSKEGESAAGLVGPQSSVNPNPSRLWYAAGGVLLLAGVVGGASLLGASVSKVVDTASDGQTDVATPNARPRPFEDSTQVAKVTFNEEYHSIVQMLPRPGHSEILLALDNPGAQTSPEIAVLDSMTLEELRRFQAPAGSNRIVSPDGRLFGGDGDRFFDPAETLLESSCALLDIDSSEVVQAFPAVSRSGCYSTFSPDGKLYYFVQRAGGELLKEDVSVQEEFSLTWEPGTIRIWDLDANVEREPLVAPTAAFEMLAHEDYLIVVTRDSEFIDGVALIDAATGEVVNQISTGQGGSGRAAPRDLVLDPNGRKLVFRVPDIKGDEIWKIDLESFTVDFDHRSSSSESNSLALSPDGRFIAVGISDLRMVHIISTGGGGGIAQRISLTEIDEVAFSHQGDLLVASGDSLLRFPVSEDFPPS